jgi:pantoate--beta-alanine ligase
VQGLTSNLCGKYRPGHFRGVATIVMKLLNIVRPDKVYVGQKDAQQAIVIKRLAADLDTGARVVIVPTVREKDGLAMSSRNTYLSAAERGLAPTIYRALQEARLLIKSGNKDARRIISKIRGQIINTVDGIDYISIVDTKDLVDIKRIEGEVLVAVAVWFGKTAL